ncbi:MAG: hypothetical protein M3328_14365 [Chloroflexota bacterium]|nr:hypothetical protein [Chloroflexota bacterium]
MKVSSGMKKAIAGALLFLVLGLAGLSGFGVHQHGAASGVTAAYAGGPNPPPDYSPPPDPDAPTPTPTPAP